MREVRDTYGMNDMSEEKYLVRVSKKTGKIDTALSGYSMALLKLWALQNTTKTKTTYVFIETGEILLRVDGGEYFPTVKYHYPSNSPHSFGHLETAMLIQAIKESEEE